jgi:FtsH-binding integral membrane protein
MDISSSHLNVSTLNERKQGVRYQKVIYALVAIELIVALVWTSFALYWWPQLGSHIQKWWEFGVVAGVLVLVLIVVTFFVEAVRRFPINWVIYILFVLAFAHFACFLNTLDPSRLLYFALWVLTTVIVAFAIYSFCASSYIPLLESFVLAFGIGTLVLIAFIVFSNHSIYLLIIVALGAVIIGFYYAYGLRTAVRFSNWETAEDDPVSGAVRFWIDGALVGCRFFEMFGHSIGSRNY